MATYEPGDYIKVEFADATTGVDELVWVQVSRCDDTDKIVFGTLYSVPVNETSGKLNLGAELAISFSQVREQRKPSDFNPTN